MIMTLLRFPCRPLAHGLVIVFVLVACKMDATTDPVHMRALPPFNPHIASFTCQVEATKVPPIDAQAEDWFLEARTLEDPFIFIDNRDYKKIVQLTRQAAERHHW